MAQCPKAEGRRHDTESDNVSECPLGSHETGSDEMNPRNMVNIRNQPHYLMK